MKVSNKVKHIIAIQEHENAILYANPYKLKRFERKQLQKFITKLNKFTDYLQED